jgi:hypothetical protein
VTLDGDLGVSGAQTTGRKDFKQLVADVSMGDVGRVFALEASRLTRSSLGVASVDRAVRDDEQRKTRCSIHANNESKEVSDSKTEDHLQTFPVPANRPRYRDYQSDTAGLGQLLSSGYVEPMFWIRQGLG